MFDLISANDELKKQENSSTCIASPSTSTKSNISETPMCHTVSRPPCELNFDEDKQQYASAEDLGGEEFQDARPLKVNYVFNQRARQG